VTRLADRRVEGKADDEGGDTGEAPKEEARRATAMLERLVAPRPGMGPIVVGVDGSQPSAAAVSWATAVARLLSAEVVLVHARPFSTEVLQDVPPLGLVDWGKDCRKKLNTVWSEPVRQAGVSFRLRLVHHSPGTALLQAAAEAGADLIVVGARHHRHGHRSTGTLSHYLVGRASCPVVAVPG
jgi:nucleotide-binding universal stress UspA family protein